MPTSLLKSKLINRRTIQSGFTMIEILVAMALMAIMFSMVSIRSHSSRKELNKVLDDIERGIRFASTEAALRNSIVRVNFSLQTDPQVYSVEYSNESSFILPPLKSESVVKSLEEEREEKAEQENLNKMFSKVKEFQEKAREIENEDIKVLGVATNNGQLLISDDSVSTYFYPTGERDGAVIFVGSLEEIATISISPFLNEITRKYYPLPEVDEEMVATEQNSKMKELYLNWQKL